MYEIEATLTRIARNYLNIATLITRRSDELDFHDVAVWTVRDALAAAYEAGYAGATRDLVQSIDSERLQAAPETLPPIQLAVLFIKMARHWLLPLRLPVAKECTHLGRALDALRALQRDLRKAHDPG